VADDGNHLSKNVHINQDISFVQELGWKKSRFFRVSSLEEFNRLAETVVDRRWSGRSGIHCHRDNMAIGNEALRRRLEDGEFKSETGITDFPDPSMNMEDLVEKRPVAVLAERFHIEKIDPGFEKFIVTVVNRFQVFSQGYIEISKIVAEKDMPLLVCLDIANLDGMEKAIQILRWVLLSHKTDFSTDGLYGKEHRGRSEKCGKSGKGEKCKVVRRFNILSRLFFPCF
jgi:hypothetical protein